MKVEDFDFPEDRFYLKNHVWLKPEVKGILLGITDLGQALSKEIVHIDLPEVGERVAKDDILVAFETIKAVSQISLPFDARVIGVNEALWEDPGRINSDPYGEWMVLLEGDFSEDKVMDVGEASKYYRGLIEREMERYAET